MQASDPRPPGHDCAHAAQLLRLLIADEIDAALETGLMDFVACPGCDPAANSIVLKAQRRLATAWAARQRYRARSARLARRAAERDTRRAQVAPEKRSALPPAAAAILARAKARAAERGKP